MGHLRLVNTNVISTALTVFSVQFLKAHTTIWPPLPHDVALPSQLFVTLKATEVLHVPAPAFRFSALLSKDDLQREKKSMRHVQITWWQHGITCHKFSQKWQ